MLLNLDQADVPMKQVFLLSDELKKNPERVILTQNLTLDKSRPHMGLKGTYGLFGSPEWWANIEQRKMPLLFLSGIIKNVYVAGQDPSPLNNTIDLLLDDGSVRAVGIYVNKKQDAKLFHVGYMAKIVYALDELKPGAADGDENYLDIALEMAVSLEPIK